MANKNKNKKMLIVASRGGEYISDQMRKFDFQKPYLRTIFGYVGVITINFIIAQPMDMGPDLQEKSLKEAQDLAVEATGNFI